MDSRIPARPGGETTFGVAASRGRTAHCPVRLREGWNRGDTGTEQQDGGDRNRWNPRDRRDHRGDRMERVDRSDHRAHRTDRLRWVRARQVVLDRALLLDIDGTLVDSAYLHVAAWQKSLRANGFDVPTFRIHRLIGMGGDQFVAALLDDD